MSFIKIFFPIILMKKVDQDCKIIFISFNFVLLDQFKYVLSLGIDLLIL